MRTCWCLVFLMIVSLPVIGQQGLLFVDKEGVLRRQADGREQAYFGVNYTLPFAYAYRHVKAMGLDLEKTIDADVYHFARLGLDAFRVHVWDTEISDAEGNLLENEHLRLFDYLIKKLKERNIRILITPIAYWGNGYPDNNVRTKGFADKFDYNKKKLVTNDTAIAAQERYIKQLLLHVNPYTKLSYRDDPSIIACEINNEPAHGEDNRLTTDYINRMADAVRSIQWKKPIFYNISQAYQNEEAFLSARVDGFTYQWYTNGLVANHTTPGNTLPYVDNYDIPYKDWKGFSDKAKVIYEFDAADVRSSYMYPAIARSFRTAGFQWATQFAWDPTPLAYANTEYQTHYLNLAYTPAKAISFLIAGKVFHQVPRYQSYGGYPQDTLFGPFRVSYTENLSEMNTDSEFYYSNSTSTKAKAPEKLQHLAGVGSSPLVQYAGTGAYFLDKIGPGAWRLELMPDAVVGKDPFTDASLTDTATYIVWKQQAMQVQLPDLGKRFRITPLNEGNTAVETTADAGRFRITPGTYLLTNTAVKPAATGMGKGLTLGLREFYAPASMRLPAARVFAEPPREHSAGEPLQLQVTVLGVGDSTELDLQMMQAGTVSILPMVRQSAYIYKVTLPGNLLKAGELQTAVRVKSNGTVIGWLRPVQVLDSRSHYELFSAARAAGDSVLKYWWRIKNFPDWNRQTAYRFEKTADSTVVYRATADTFNFDIPFIGWQYSCSMIATVPQKSQQNYSTLTLRGAPAGRHPVTVLLILVDRNANAYSRELTLEGGLTTYRLPLSTFSKGPLLLLPRPYPMFLPLWFSTAANEPIQLSAIEKIQLLYMPARNLQVKEDQGFMIDGVWAE
ncbi:MAG: membrane or secreted protein [Candidatus Pseudobacter hemicellulosilyticus]|uniref:Membrane or secreted protein n=1 Tax=Candidatus Pseudobacter hemicellulosilyticus TaxID=3121375 RepID=A0AAJ6BEK1_9BACT|nr:MAG: membrane or secreted protein [Pseudobacter sp.]